jgi:hypothetical protein
MQASIDQSQYSILLSLHNIPNLSNREPCA